MKNSQFGVKVSQPVLTNLWLALPDFHLMLPAGTVINLYAFQQNPFILTLSIALVPTGWNPGPVETTRNSPASRAAFFVTFPATDDCSMFHLPRSQSRPLSPWAHSTSHFSILSKPTPAATLWITLDNSVEQYKPLDWDPSTWLANHSSPVPVTPGLASREPRAVCPVQPSWLTPHLPGFCLSCTSFIQAWPALGAPEAAPQEIWTTAPWQLKLCSLEIQGDNSVFCNYTKKFKSNPISWSLWLGPSLLPRILYSQTPMAEHFS